MVIDSDPTSRSILVAQLRDFGMVNIVQCARLSDARRHLEQRKFDIVLCELRFSNELSSGQDLLDDLRRNQLLPFSTVFIMVTNEATYAKVAEAAESALDGYLLKPHKANQLGDRLRQARIRKISLKDIFSAIETENFTKAAELCLHRFQTKGLFWLYAARVGAELLLRTGKCAEAQELYEAVIAAKTLPWAKLGVARSLLDDGQVVRAATTLENLIGEDPGYADAYDVMGRAQFELGKFDQALATFKMAADLTPASISRLQNLGMLSYYTGDRQESEKILDKTVRLGLDSKMFDCQTLVLLAFTRLGSGDRKGLQRCRDDFARLIERNPDNQRYQRLSIVVDALSLIQQQLFGQAINAVRDLANASTLPDFDFESASNLLALMAYLANRTIQMEEMDSVVAKVSMRFCINRSITELLAGAASAHEPYVTQVRAAQTQIIKLSEHALSLSMGGNPGAAVKDLILHGNLTLNGRFIETAHLVLQRYIDSITDADELAETVKELRTRYATNVTRVVLGEKKRQAGGLTLRTGGAPIKARIMLPQSSKSTAAAAPPSDRNQLAHTVGEHVAPKATGGH